MFKNIMSVDLEDHFCDLPFSTWSDYDSRVVKTTNVILKLFEKYKINATFFTVGYVAEKHPDLIEDIVSKGHEIASHGYSHTDIRKMTKESFESDLVNSLETLQRISGERIIGFRAPWFSINRSNFWVFDIMKKHLKYDSSIYPVKFHYGFSDAPRHVYKMSEDYPLEENVNGKFKEIPLATLHFPGLGNFPIAGGIYLRFLPVQLLKLGIKKLNKSGFSATIYIHPQDLDFERPRLKGLAWHNFVGLRNATKKFESILKDFSFSSIREVEM